MDIQKIGDIHSAQTLNARDTVYFDDEGQDFLIQPLVNIVKIGGQSIMDRGAKAVLPLVEELVECKQEHKIIVGTGGGTRSRHTYQVAMDLGMPTGVVARLGSLISRQNAKILHVLLCKHGGIFVLKETFEQIPFMLQAGCMPIIDGMPPYEIYERPARGGRIPENRTDTGIYLIGEVLGARSVTFVKDERGLYTDDPKKNPKAEFIPEIGARELLEMDLPDLVVERKTLELLLTARHVKKIQIVNGLERGNLKRALAGEHVGTIISAD